MNRYILSFVSILFFIIVGCEKKAEPAKLSIVDVVAESHDGGNTVSLGGTVSVNFTAKAGDNARLDFYHVEIHDHPASGAIEDEYKIIDDDFKDLSVFTGLREAYVHQHVSVPDTANLGSYHVVVTIVDAEGYSVNTEALETHIEIVE